MWALSTTPLQADTTCYKILENNTPLSFVYVISLLNSSEQFRSFYSGILQNSKYPAFFWEVKPVTKQTMHQPFEFVLVNSSSLLRITADKSAFAEHLNNSEPVVSFHNLGKDAVLIVPNQISDKHNYAHLAMFIRNAPTQQVDAFWQRVGKEYAKTISDKPLWLSTAGLGVSWLHVRVDSRPKYYRHQPYTNLT